MINALFVLCWSYKGRNFLPGVVNDYLNLDKSIHFKKKTFLINNAVDELSVETNVKHLAPNLIWFCGHGDGRYNFYEKDLQQEYFLLINGSILTDITLSNIVRKYNKERLVLVFDVCKSASLLDLEFSWNFDKNKLEPHPSSKKSPIKYSQKIIALSGCLDSTFSLELKTGGVFTNFLLSLLNKYGFINIKSIINEYNNLKDKRLLPKFTISTNDACLRDTDAFLESQLC